MLPLRRPDGCVYSSLLDRRKKNNPRFELGVLDKTGGKGLGDTGNLEYELLSCIPLPKI